MKSILALSAASFALFSSSAFAAAKINEFEPNPVGSDAANQMFEFTGTPLANFMGWILSIEADNGSSLGTVDRASMVAGTFDANGLLVVSIPDLENPSNTVFLVDVFNGSVGDDIDTDNDGTADVTLWDNVLDAVGIVDNGTDASYAGQFGGTDIAYIGDEPKLVFRDSVTMEWLAVDDRGQGSNIFNAAGEIVTAAFGSEATSDTFGRANPTAAVDPVPVPAAALLFAPAIALLRRRGK
ncbi:MAG: hypothetical protein HRU11_06150 [Parvularculaceae bacterium]|nr:hypothetical protein [Parvularculaceae bacterium]